jgi:tRNA (mo5U34)-methyltransferase
VASSIDPDRFRLPIDVARTLTDDADEAERISKVTWYHTIDLPGGVVTPGEFDHRPLVPHYGLPDDLSGRRALDVATNNGFWAFELEKRGADVSAVDVGSVAGLDFPPGVRGFIERKGIDAPVGEGFEIAHGLLGSKVRKIVTNVYDLDPREHGTYDFVHIADVLLHLRDPLRALERVRSVTDGTALIVDGVDPDLASGASLTHYRGGWSTVVWWLPSVEVLAQMVVDAGFSEVRVGKLYNLPTGYGAGLWRTILHATV